MIETPSAAAPGHPGPQPGLRERQKARTRAAIRLAALDLIDANGYEATTVAQIAEAAGVSHTTFFRYFQTKEQVIVSDDLEPHFIDSIARVPPGLNRFDLVRTLIGHLFELGRVDEWVSEPRRARLLRDEPVLRAANQLAAEKRFSQLTEFLAEYTGVEVDSLRLKVFVGAVSGAMSRLVECAEEPTAELMADMLTAIDLLEQGLPL